MNPLRPTTGPDRGPPRRCVLLFARGDRAEAGAKGLGRAGAAVFGRLRRRVAEAVAALPGVDLVVVGARGALDAAHVLPQRGLDFGARFSAALQDARSLGYEQVVAVGLDAPRLGAHHLTEAFAALERHPVVLGPARDGGVYLFGCGRASLEPLRGVRWLGRHVLADLRAAFGPAPRLETLGDVDDLESARRLAAADPELARLIRRLRPARPGGPPAARAPDRPAPKSLPIRGPPSA